MTKQKGSSGVSSALLQVQNTVQTGSALIDQSVKGQYTIKVANTLEEREAAFRLGYKTYLEKGYIQKNQEEMLVCDYDFNDDTVILIVQDKDKNIAGSTTLVFDESFDLPANNVYRQEVNTLKRLGKRTSEICRFVVNSDYRNVKEILALLFNYMAIYITRVKCYDGLVIEVTPRHKNYYKELLHFTEIGAEKCCPQVQNTVGVLLYLSSAYYRSALENAMLPNGLKKNDHSIYPYLLKGKQEDLVADCIEKQVKRMNDIEKAYFGFSEKVSENVHLV